MPILASRLGGMTNYLFHKTDVTPATRQSRAGRSNCAAKRRYLRRLAPKARPPQPPKINTTRTLIGEQQAPKSKMQSAGLRGPQPRPCGGPLFASAHSRGPRRLLPECHPHSCRHGQTTNQKPRTASTKHTPERLYLSGVCMLCRSDYSAAGASAASVSAEAAGAAASALFTSSSSTLNSRASLGPMGP